jgi:hypothetical protein
MGFWSCLVLGCVKVGFLRMWVGHGETPWRDRDRYFEEMSSLPIY